jgi:hypothetical protein
MTVQAQSVSNHNDQSQQVGQNIQASASSSLAKNLAITFPKKMGPGCGLFTPAHSISDIDFEQSGSTSHSTKEGAI